MPNMKLNESDRVSLAIGGGERRQFNSTGSTIYYAHLILLLHANETCEDTWSERIELSSYPVDLSVPFSGSNRINTIHHPS